MKLKIALICLIVLLILTINAQAKTPVTWDPKEIEQTIGLGGEVDVSATFTSTVTLNDVDLWIVPELQAFVSLNQTHFTVMEANTPYHVTLQFFIPFGSETGLYDGTIHVRTSSETHPQTLKIELDIADAAATIGPEGGVIEVTDPESPIYGVGIDIPPGALDQDTQFSVGYDGLKDIYGLATPPVVVDHPDIKFHENINVSLPLREIPIEDTTLIVMMFNDELSNYVPTGVLVDVAAGDTVAEFQLSHLSTITTASIWDSLDIYEWSDDEFTSLLSHLKDLVDEIEKYIEGGPIQDLDELVNSWKDCTCQDVPCTVIKDTVAGPLMYNIKRLIDEVVSKLAKDMNICHDLGEDRIAFFPYTLGGFDYYRFELETVNDDPNDVNPCMGRCGKGCPGDGTPDCGGEFRYSQACLNHDACGAYYGSVHDPQCYRILASCMDDCESLFFPICEKAGCHTCDTDYDGCVDFIEYVACMHKRNAGEVSWEELQEAYTIGLECDPSQPCFYDNFEDGVINANWWVVGGSNGGVGGAGSGGGLWYNEEFDPLAVDPQWFLEGCLQARATTPISANTYGSQAWTRTVQDFNNGSDWRIDFMWEPDIKTIGQWHADYHLIEITDGCTDWLYGLYAHPQYNLLPGTHQLYLGHGQDFNPVYWSIIIDASESKATLYKGHFGSETIHSTKQLRSEDAWYIRFITTVATSSGYPAKDCRINLYHFATWEY